MTKYRLRGNPFERSGKGLQLGFGSRWNGFTLRPFFEPI